MTFTTSFQKAVAIAALSLMVHGPSWGASPFDGEPLHDVGTVVRSSTLGAPVVMTVPVEGGGYRGVVTLELTAGSPGAQHVLNGIQASEVGDPVDPGQQRQRRALENRVQNLTQLSFLSEGLDRAIRKALTDGETREFQGQETHSLETEVREFLKRDLRGSVAGPDGPIFLQVVDYGPHTIPDHAREGLKVNAERLSCLENQGRRIEKEAQALMSTGLSRDEAFQTVLATQTTIQAPIKARCGLSSPSMGTP